MLILSLSNALNTGCNSSSMTAKSPSTMALSSLPAKAAHVLTPMSLSMLVPCIFAGRPIVNLTMPSLDSPCALNISLRGPAVIEFFSGSRGSPTIANDPAGFRFLGCGPGAKAHEWGHPPAIDHHFHVVAWKGDFVNGFLLVHLAFEA